LQLNWQHILDACKKGDPQVQEKLYRYYYPSMIKLCFRYSKGNKDEAGAIYNQAMLKVLQRIHQYQGTGEPGAWIRKIVLNCCIDYCRSRIKPATDELSDTADILQVIPDTYNRISANEVLELINELPVNTALVFNLFVMEGYKHEEIGKILGISAGTSKWHLNEARRLLKIKLETFLQKEYMNNGIRTATY
jgi:RNA polymerase sigma-70 factor, ECF subfamily